MADTHEDCKLVYRMLTAYVTDINRRTQCQSQVINSLLSKTDWTQATGDDVKLMITKDLPETEIFTGDADQCL